MCARKSKYLKWPFRVAQLCATETTEYPNMANGSTHRMAAAVVVGSACFYAEANQQTKTVKPIVGTGLAAILTSLPDMIEPASHPNHRQFFHSLAFAGLLGLATEKSTNGKQITLLTRPPASFYWLVRQPILFICCSTLVRQGRCRLLVNSNATA